MKNTLIAQILPIAAALLLSGCASTGSNSLDQALATQDEKVQTRYQYRNPKETLEFFGIKPGMKVAEALPGGGWYTKILLPHLGKEGHLMGVDYSIDMYKHFGGFATEEFLEKKKTWTTTWSDEARTWTDENGPSINAATLANFSEQAAGSLDAVLFIRAMHNLARFSEQGDYLNKAINESYAALKPGGIVGIVQHQAREDRPDEWANGSNGYLKKSTLIKAMTDAGFSFIGESDVNNNPKDQASEGDIVWRLPPSFAGSRDDEKKKAEMTAIGESHRMTLKFAKPTK